MTRRAKVSPLQHPAPSAAALAARRKDERLQIASRQAPISNGSMRGTYSGAELRTCDSRPGAMDAYGLPTLHGGKRTHLPLHASGNGGKR